VYETEMFSVADLRGDEMKTIMCYGDSLTWGYNPTDGSRYPFEQRWPGVLQNELGSGVRVIEEALNGRTVATDSWVLPNRDGRAMLGPLLESHAPLDLVIIMLGTNDVGPTYRLSASEVAFGCATLVWAVQKSQVGPAGGTPEVLLIAPPSLGELSGLMELFYKGGEGTSSELARAYQTVAQACRCHFLDASKIVQTSKVDGVHLDPAGQRALASEVKNVITTVLTG
jgi:lysophospholipase L1-like esterase